MNGSIKAALLAAGLLLSTAIEVCADEPQDAGQHVFYLGEERVMVLRFQVLVDGQPYAVAWQNFLDKRFKALDVDSDGVLSNEEARGMPTPNLLMQMGLLAQTGQKPGLLSPATSNDGKITQAEFMAHFQRLRLEPFRIQMDAAPTVRSMGGVAVARRQAADEAPRVLFEKLDADSDGAITPDDFKNAQQALRKLDLDRDESISASELVQTANIFAVAATSANSNQPPKPKFLSTSGQSRLQLARELHTARDGHAGGAKDNRLSFAELGMPAEKLSSFDADGDGALDFEETQQFLNEPPADVQLLVRLGKRQPNEQAMEFLGESSGSTANNVASLTVGKVQMEFAPQADNTSYRQSYINTFKAADQDNNGYLEAMEGQRFGISAAVFSELDADKDGKLFEKEYLGFMEPLAEMERARVQVNISERGRDLFRILDTSGDGRLGPREFQAAISRMTHWDSNDDGKLASEELPQQFRVTVGRGQVSPSGRAVVLASPAAIAPGVRTQQAGGPPWFSKMDRNGDGDVSQLEFLGPSEVFARLDQDANGLVDAVEAAKVKN